MASRKVNQALPSMSCEQKSVINLGYDIPNKPHDNATAPIGRLAPVFGGRMTEKRLKEVGKMTKEAIEDLHKSVYVHICFVYLFIIHTTFFKYIIIIFLHHRLQ